MFLSDGPCAIRYSRLKTSDASISNPSPAEIVQRHNQLVHSIENYLLINLLPLSLFIINDRVLSIAASKGQPEENGVAIATEQAWDHVQSLYQHSSSTCLFGKNNILVKPVSLVKSAPYIIIYFDIPLISLSLSLSLSQAGFSEPVQGYLTLQQELTGLILKWIPNSLLKDASNASR